MQRSNRRARRLAWLGLLAVLPPAAAFAGLTVQGLTVQGLTVQGLTVQGLTVQGLTVQGLTVQGLTVQGLTVQGLTVQGLTVQGLTVQGLTVQGLTVHGLSPMGTDLGTTELKGVAIGPHCVGCPPVEIRGTTSTSGTVSYELTSVPGVSTGSGNYISVGGGSAVGHYATAHLVDANNAPAEDIDLFIAGEQRDPVLNQFQNPDEQDNQDQLYVVYAFQPQSGEWVSLCPYNPLTQSASAMAIPEDPKNLPNNFILACTATGVASKCARNWGYRPWASTQAYFFDDGTQQWKLETRDLKPYYDVCKTAARAGYCQDGKSFTKNGTQVDLFDTRQIIWPNAIQNPFNIDNSPDSLWMMSQEYFISFDPAPLSSAMQASALQRTRYRELSPVGQCADFAFVDRLEHDNVEDARWASPLTNTPRLQIFSPTSCTHNEYEKGPQSLPLPWDCSPCTTKVCQTNPSCCGAGPSPAWDDSCIAAAVASCNDLAGQWPAGLVWPRDIPVGSPSPTPTKFLLGPGGAVLSADGASTASTSATISGWACDPEWPGSAVSVQIYGGAPREEGGSALLGEVRADQALEIPLADEVSAACDGPGRTYARHGFSFTLPANQQGNVFVYAIDQDTADGPAAPPTLIRNGIVHVPTCAHSEHVTGAALDSTCSTCAGSICGDGTHGACCTTAWIQDCVDAADTCSPTSSSAPASSNALAAVATGWIEAPADGLYVFDASLQPSRVSINGTTIIDWFNGVGGTQGSITLAQGQRYALRWDRLQSEPAPALSGPGLTWQLPGAGSQTPIPSGALYELAPGSGTGLAATYYTSSTFSGPVPPRLDKFVDLNNDVTPPGQAGLDLPTGVSPGDFSATWEGEFVPSFSEDYTFYVDGAGDPTLTVNGSTLTLTALPGVVGPPAEGAGCDHNVCETGDKLTPTIGPTPACNSCVDKICAPNVDPYCCNGGYLSYYSTEPVWDAKCVAEVAAICGITCTNTLAPPVGVPPERRSSSTVTLQAGVHYPIRFDYAYSNVAVPDKTVRLFWSSARTAKQIIPTTALYPKGNAPAAAGAGLNLTVFGTQIQNEKVQPVFTAAVAAGTTADLSTLDPVGPLGLPVVTVLASTSDVARGTPPPPAVVRPRYQDQVIDTTARAVVHGIGGVTGGSVRITVDEDASIEVIAPIASDGTFDATVPFATFGTWTLRFVQRTYPTAPCATSLCADSYSISWPVTISAAPPPPSAPLITTPRDPTHSPNPLVNTFVVNGTGAAGALVNVHDSGGSSATANGIGLVAGADGTIAGSVQLSPGDVDPNAGWHRLTFDQGGPASKPVFVSVGVRPPTVAFPRTGAVLDCSQPDPVSPQVTAIGTLPYPQETFGRLRVFEETGHEELGSVGAETRVINPQNAGDPIVFVTTFNPGFGKHVLYFFQAPDPPSDLTTQAQVDEWFRAFSTIANTPTSRIEIERRPPRFQLAQGGAVIRGNVVGVPNTDVRLFVPTQALALGPLNLTSGACDTTPDVLCALPNADVNVRLGERTFTTRADANGTWTLSVPLPIGWSDVTLSQVVDSTAGGAWSESCRSNGVGIGVQTPGGPLITAPGDMTVNATSAAGAAVSYVVTAVSASDGTTPVAVTCVPPSGSTFPQGKTAVLCTAVDPTTNAVGLAHFAITVVNGPPVINVPPNITAEATSALGAMVSYDVTATDAEDGTDPVDCTPASPAQFALDTPTTVSCTATDSGGLTSTASFVVQVVDTTPPTLCPLSNLAFGTNSGAGAVVTYTTCANDMVDGPDPVNCDHPSGSFFPVGTTVVSCSSTDKHGNKSPVSTFTVCVSDTTPPVLSLPGTINVHATSRLGAKVSYVATATDNVDPHPTVTCTPPSGAQFPLGTTTVNCTAKDASGNTSTGSFKVKVTVSWSGFLFPIQIDGTGTLRWIQKVPLPVVFALLDGSAGIRDLPAKLFIAPLDATGHPGAERPAPKLPPIGANGFDFVPVVNDYLFTLDTRPLALGTWQLRADLGDGELHTVKVTLVH